MNINYFFIVLFFVNIIIEMMVYFGCKICIVFKILLFLFFEGVEWQYSFDGEYFFLINIGIEKYIEINFKVDYLVFMILKIILEDKKYYWFFVWNKMGILFSNILFLNVIESKL